MELSEVRQKYLEFFKARKHAVIPSASLVPENDPTTLFTGSGMQPLVPYLLGQPHPLGKRVVNSQKSFRAEDIDEVGDNRHTTFFEMLGNWSFGDYFKAEQLPWFFEFLTKEIGLKPENLYVTVFAGDPETKIPADEESAAIWKKLFAEKGIEAEYIQFGSEERASEIGMQGRLSAGRQGRIFSYDVEKNWWSRAGVPAKMPAGEPGGPDSEVFYDFGTAHDEKFGKLCHPNCDCGRFLEIGNSVFMEYKKKEDGSFEKLAQRNVDFGGGLERITAAANNDPDVFNIDIFNQAKEILKSETGESYAGNEKIFRVIFDHVRAAVFLIADGVSPSNIGRGYLVRRLLRRAVRFGDGLRTAQGEASNQLSTIATLFIEQYKDPYLGGQELMHRVIQEIDIEEQKFRETLARGLREFEKLSTERVSVLLLPDGSKQGILAGSEVFNLYQSYGFPIELTREMAKEKGLAIDEDGYKTYFILHQGKSRTASAGTFKGGLADHSEKTTQLHTTHHLLLRALQIVLGPQVKQRGSNITSERLRIDFSHDAKMTDEQKKEVERIVNEKIAEDLPVIRSEMPLEEAEKLHAEHEFGQKYPERVSVYSVGPKSATLENPQFNKAYSIEFCGGPHVNRTGEIKGTFKIAKEEASSAGIRRVRGVLE